MATTTFKKWIKKYEGEDTPAGVLARDIAQNEFFPDTAIRHEMLTHLQVRPATPELMAIFKQVYDDYRVWRKREAFVK